VLNNNHSFTNFSLVSPGTPVSSTNKTDRHDITEILLKVALNTINQKNQSFQEDSSVRHTTTLHQLLNTKKMFSLKHLISLLILGTDKYDSNMTNIAGQY
jgi:hypothetical protein